MGRVGTLITVVTWSVLTSSARAQPPRLPTAGGAADAEALIELAPVLERAHLIAVLTTGTSCPPPPQALTNDVNSLGCGLDRWAAYLATNRTDVRAFAVGLRAWVDTQCASANAANFGDACPRADRGTGIRWSLVPSVTPRARTSADAADITRTLGAALTLGLASFLVERAEVELQRWATDQLRTIAGCATPPSATHTTLSALTVSDLLPATCGHLGTARSEIVTPVGAGLVASFEADIRALPGRLAAVTDLGNAGLRTALRVVDTMLRARSAPHLARELGGLLFDVGLTGFAGGRDELRDALGAALELLAAARASGREVTHEEVVVVLRGMGGSAALATHAVVRTLADLELGCGFRAT